MSDANNSVEPANNGPTISLRDYFAAAALTGLLVNGSDYPFELSAEDAYKLADRMLEARGGQQ